MYENDRRKTGYLRRKNEAGVLSDKHGTGEKLDTMYSTMIRIRNLSFENE